MAENDLLDETVVIRAKPLTPEEAIGNPEGEDFPIMPCPAGSGIDGSLLAIHY